ncbi:TrkA C-terminal domain-containing protein [Oceanimonas sp. NS1]|nr:TrkA C-terminal domain-containing protein [Oceanimonas sp. NS1]
MELVILPSSELLGRTARGIQLRTRFGVNLLAVSRQGSVPSSGCGRWPFAPAICC